MWLTEISEKNSLQNEKLGAEGVTQWQRTCTALTYLIHNNPQKREKKKFYILSSMLLA